MVFEKQAKEGFDVRDSMRELSCCYSATYREIRIQVCGRLGEERLEIFFNPTGPNQQKQFSLAN